VHSFWAEIHPCQHVVEIYSDEGAFIESLATFVHDGIAKGEATIVIATASHASSLELNLERRGVDVPHAVASGSYCALDAATTLSRFMIDGWPDEERFTAVIEGILAPPRIAGRRVRAFGEMVALLWAQGHHGATVQLEHMWNGICDREGLALYCAYPRIGATRGLVESLDEVCRLHTQVMDNAVAFG
jgi:hypothetical protein